MHEVGDLAGLDDRSGVQHDDPVGDLGHDAEVVADQHDADVEPVPDVHQYGENLALDGHVEGRRRLVGDEEIRPADERHPYGYQRYETLGVLLIGVLMFVSSWEIIREVVTRLLAHRTLDIAPWALYGMLLALPVNGLMTWWEYQRGRRLGSELLLADAMHTRTDLLVTLGVIGALLGVRWGFPWLDPVMALAVVAFILRASWELVSQAARYLADARIADPHVIEQIAREVPGVQDVHHIRSRGKPGAAFVDLHVRVPPGMSTDQAHAIATEVEQRLRHEVPGVAEAIVHIEPAQPQGMLSEWERAFLQLRRLADGLGLGLHELHLHAHPRGGLLAEMHLEFPTPISLAEASQQATAFRRRAQATIPDLREVVLHLEPLASQVEAAEPPPKGMARRLEAFLTERLTDGEVLSVTLYSAGGHLHAAVRVALPGGWPLEQAHEVADWLQREALQAFPALRHVAIEAVPLPQEHGAASQHA